VARNYEIQRIDGLPPEEAHPSSPDILARIQREHAMVAEARKTDSDMNFFAEPLDWPAKGVISGLFGSQRILNGTPSAPHFGVDIAGGEGAPIHAPASGTVLVADQFFLEG
jgi:murein DD-endopeptidase MepM/ murein hydrolase activator NlpD